MADAFQVSKQSMLDLLKKKFKCLRLCSLVEWWGISRRKISIWTVVEKSESRFRKCISRVKNGKVGK